ncbi:MAG: hypothetical protein K2W95_09765 [Candidatus Obscuribacterales bacterium]|nr:hypothetical protein [Candidatus Obscuribacterales bacterium]
MDHVHDNENNVSTLLEGAAAELLLQNGSKAELLLRKAYGLVYDQLTPLHLKVIEILRQLVLALEMQGKVIESTEVSKFIAEMVNKNNASFES